MKSTFPLALGVLLITSGAAFATDAIPPDATPSTHQMTPAASSTSVSTQEQIYAPTKDAAAARTTTTTSESATMNNGDTQKTDTTKQTKTSAYQSKTAPVVESSTGTTTETTTTSGAVAPSNSVQKLFNFLQHSNTQTQAGATPDKSASPSTTDTTKTP